MYYKEKILNLINQYLIDDIVDSIIAPYIPDHIEGLLLDTWTNPNFFHPNGITCDEKYIYIANTYKHTIMIFDHSKKWITTLGKYKGDTNNEFDNPITVCVDDDYLYVLDCCNHRIQIYKKDLWTYIRTINVVDHGPMTLLSVDDEFIYVGTSYIVHKYNKNGMLEDTINSNSITDRHHIYNIDTRWMRNIICITIIDKTTLREREKIMLENTVEVRNIVYCSNHLYILTNCQICLYSFEHHKMILNLNLQRASGMCYNGLLYVCDTQNNRILTYI